MTTSHSRVKPVSSASMATKSEPTTEARYLPSDVRRRQILDAAARLAVEEGLEGTSIARVAEAAGVAKGSIYLHFDSRQQLLAGLQADLWQRMLEKPFELIEDEALSWVAKLDAVVEHWMVFEWENHGLYHAVFHTIAPGGEEPMAEARSLLEKLLVGGQTAGEFDLDGIDVEVVLDFLLHGYIGPCFHHGDQAVALEDVKKLFRRTVGVSS